MHDIQWREARLQVVDGQARVTCCPDCGCLVIDRDVHAKKCQEQTDDEVGR